MPHVRQPTSASSESIHGARTPITGATTVGASSGRTTPGASAGSSPDSPEGAAGPVLLQSIWSAPGAGGGGGGAGACSPKNAQSHARSRRRVGPRSMTSSVTGTSTGARASTAFPDHSRKAEHERQKRSPGGLPSPHRVQTR